MSVLQSDRHTRMLFSLLVLVCVVIRIVLLVTYGPVSSNDTSGYVAVAQNLRALDFSSYDAQRTPGYPLLILLGGFDDRAVSVIQSVLGILTSLMLFVIALHHTGSRNLSFAIGVSHSLVFNTLFLEIVVMTEVLAIFLLVLSLLLYTVLTKSKRNGRRVLYHVGLALVVSWAALTRPLLALLAPIYFLFLLFKLRGAGVSRGERFACLSGYVVPTALAIVGWCFFNFVTVGYFGLTTLTGLNLVQHGLPYSNLAGDEYAAIRTVIHGQRQLNLQTTGSCQVDIWSVRPRIQEATNLSLADLSRELTNMTVDIFSRRPLFYIQSVWEAWLRFWLGPNIIGQDKIEKSIVTTVVLAAWRVERPLVFLMNILFLNIALYLVHQSIVSRTTEPVIGFEFLIATIVVSASVVQALMENGSNMRYELPYQPLTLYVAAVAVWRFFSRGPRFRGLRRA
jgi:hypothetical protein